MLSYNLAFVDYFTFYNSFFSPQVKRELDDYHQKLNIRVNSRDAERFSQEISRKALKCLDWMASSQSTTQRKILAFELKNRKKSVKKHSIEKHIFLNFVNLSTIICQRLQINLAQFSSNRSIHLTITSYYQLIQLIKSKSTD